MRLSYSLLLLALSTPFTASAQQNDEPKFELTPFGSYRFGGDFDDVDNDINIDLEEGAGLRFYYRVEIRQQSTRRVAR